MPEMYITSPIVKRFVDEYDFLLSSGVLYKTTLDLALGDSIEFTPNEIRIVLRPRPGKIDPTKLTPHEEIILYKSQLVGFEHRTVEVQERTPDQQAEWDNLLKEVSAKTTH